MHLNRCRCSKLFCIYFTLIIYTIKLLILSYVVFQIVLFSLTLHYFKLIIEIIRYPSKFPKNIGSNKHIGMLNSHFHVMDSYFI